MHVPVTLFLSAKGVACVTRPGGRDLLRHGEAVWVFNIEVLTNDSKRLLYRKFMSVWYCTKAAQYSA